MAFEYTLLNIRAAAATHPGRVRGNNQDHVLVWTSNSPLNEPRALLVVADGVGGHRAGEIASQVAVEALHQALQPMLVGDSVTRPLASGMMTRMLYNALQQANQAVHRAAQQNPLERGDMGTTIACILVLGDLAVLGSIGDTRIYRCRGGKLQQLSRDHSLVADLVNAGLLEAHLAQDHPRRNVLTQVLGTQEGVQPDLKVIDLRANDLLLICSDGLWGMVNELRELEALACPERSVETITQELIDLANQLGGYDNISVAVLQVLPRQSRPKTE